ncbi:MAG: glycosyltransferase family 39 protein [Salinivirgaceae bacterium]
MIILLTASALRFYKFQDQPFTHDEFSTLFRLEYNSLKDVIQIGMRELDNHPIGTQVFYYYYTKLVGTGEMAVKLPIVLMGILAVYFVYLLGRRWFNNTAGLYAASFMAVLQYAVVQSQIARMYGFGILFVLLMAYYWDLLIHKKFALKNAIGYVLTASLCAYNHYFSLLFVAIVWITGVFIRKEIGVKNYFLLGLLIFLLFVPHLGIFFYQLSKGGIEGWLGKFEFTYFFFYLSYVYHHSWVVALAAILPILLLFTKKIEHPVYRKLVLIWFLLPMLIGFTYSYFRNNVIHERVLYFSFPFLLLFLASFIKRVSLKKEFIIVLSILSIGTSSLFLERHHYQLFTNNRYKLVAESLALWSRDINPEDLLIVKFTHKKIDEYYVNKYHQTKPEILYGEALPEIKDFIKLLENTHKEFLYFGRATLDNPTYLQIALKYFPKMLKKNYTVAGEAYLLQRNDKPFKWPCLYQNYEVYLEPDNTIDNISNQEFIGTIEALTDTLIFSDCNIIELETTIKQLDSVGGAKIVSSMEHKGKIIDWRAAEIDDFILSDTCFNTAMFTVPIPDIRLKKNTRVKFFIWNPNKAGYRVKNFSLITRPGNPYIYGGTESIPWNTEPFCIEKLNTTENIN